MGLLKTQWDAVHEGHAIVVTRTEIGRGFKIEWDGEEIAKRAWSFFGLGELHGTAESGDKHYDVRVVLDWAGFKELNGKCTITVDGTEIQAKLVR